ncbi:MAG TPA: hypothetical protein VHU40_21700 [Polyangia bacterium]|nr:hypothetical protein [Polyangia bacterium]
MNTLVRIQKLALPFAVAGLGVLLAGAFLDPTRAFTNLLIGALLVMGFATGAMVWLCLLAVANAGWAAVLKRVLEGFGAFVPVGALLILATTPGLRAVYAWARPGAGADPLLAAKAAFLNPTFFLIRMVVILGLWTLFTARLRRWSLAQDAAAAAIDTTAATKRWAAGFLATFAITACLAAFDWVMAIEATWYSTIFGLYNLAGILASSAAAVAIAAVLLQRAGVLPELRPDHLHDLGKLMLGFATFWGYLWFSQFLLIWYSNLPDETSYYELRWQGGWQPLFFANLLAGWTVPFLALLPRGAKRSPTHLLRVGVLMLGARWLDLWLMTMPGNFAARPWPGLFELAGVVGPLALFVFVVTRTFQRVPLIARRDPFLAESLHHHI